MGIISWIVLGLIAGIIAKWIMPGKDGGGFILTTLLGIAGAFVGGFVGSFLGLGEVGSFSLGSMATAVVGALILLFVYRQIKSKS
ncbi:GlsB/YeaQ/YmgE family stress response membrane protein [Glaciecola petra]|uniref:GlsB/YeaQ/YmgE family stress response membrane protein n=1 Tax=Glaciecola petra TaxID=3075602 RepID=A0ABU2ZLM0_9ALTE|nr:GlsB/YeaQ/YmgE family stress response membrane protein [Aestuariibacter sp. P117]MDT0593301.1 GlsB/YeaQ/YmgE family stress response membrane protein [Aestuariibacter sp. P117]